MLKNKETFIVNTTDIDVVMSLYNVECSGNYSIKSGYFWNYYRDEVHNDVNENSDDNYRVNN